MLIELTNKYTKDVYTGYEKRCDKHYVKKEDILRISNEYGEDIESYWKDRYKYNYYCYINENGKTIKIQIDYETFIKLQELLGKEVENEQNN